jgi:MFS family permease
VLIALCPNIVLTTAWTLIAKPVGHSIALGPTGLEVIEGLSNAGYAFGALVGGDLVRRLPHRPLFLGCELLFVAASALAAFAVDWPMFAVGRIVQGLATGFLLVVAIPPLVQRFEPSRLPTTAAGVNIGFFGAVAAGPLVGGAAGLNLHDWRYLVGGLGALALVGVVLCLLSLADEDAPDPGLEPDWAAFALAAIGTGAPFVGVSLLASPTRGYSAPAFWAPLAAGAAAIVALLVVEYRKENALAPVKPLATTYPLIGIIVASLGGAAFVTALQLGLGFMTGVSHDSPLDAGLTVWPEVATVLAAAVAFWLFIRTRWLAAFVLAGLVLLCAGCWLLTEIGHRNVHTIVLASSALLGAGAGATVAPALWLAGFSVEAALVGRVFALVELIRAEADYVVAPVLRKISKTAAGVGSPAHGIQHALWLNALIAIATTAVCVGLWLTGRGRFERPDLEAYVDEGEPGVTSPPLLGAVRS